MKHAWQRYLINRNILSATILSIILFCTACFQSPKYGTDKNTNDVTSAEGLSSETAYKMPTTNGTISAEKTITADISNNNKNKTIPATSNPTQSVPQKINGGWKDMDITNATHYVIQKSCIDPAPSNGGDACPAINGWDIFWANGALHARKCVNGGINPRWFHHNNEMHFWCDPPPGRDALGGVLPFSIHMKTQLSSLAGSANPSHFPADWTRGNDGTYNSNGYFINDTGRDLVLHRMTAYLDASPFNVGIAAVDVCLFINDQRNSRFGDAVIATHNEVLCTNQRKIGNQWPASTQSITFPGQGHIVAAGAIVVCDSQAAAEQVTNATVGNFSNFSCVLEFKEVDMKSSLPVVQSIRTPFIDEAFNTTTLSRFTPHINLTSNNLYTYGAWAYTSTREKKTDACLYWGDGTYPQRSCYTASHFPNGESHSPMYWLSYNTAIPHGQIIGGNCQTDYGDAAGSGCAFYFMVGLNKGTTRYEPLRRKHTIHKSTAEAYCYNPYPAYYTLNDTRFSSPEACMSLLEE